MDETDWNAMARARGSQLADSELDRILDPLRNLEQRFRPLAQGISPTLDPATVFRADAESGE
jgi:hypothetical protein